MALRLLEKDIHEKQDSVVTLRLQLDEIKTINLELYNKLQVSQVRGQHEVRGHCEVRGHRETSAG